MNCDLSIRKILRQELPPFGCDTGVLQAMVGKVSKGSVPPPFMISKPKGYKERAANIAQLHFIVMILLRRESQILYPLQTLRLSLTIY